MGSGSYPPLTTIPCGSGMLNPALVWQHFPVINILYGAARGHRTDSGSYLPQRTRHCVSGKPILVLAYPSSPGIKIPCGAALGPLMDCESYPLLMILLS